MKKVSIVGFGRFGKTLFRLLESHFEVTILDRGTGSTNEMKGKRGVTITQDLTEIYKSDVVFLCPPIAKFEDLIKKHRPHFQPGQTLIDVLSVKEYPKHIFSKYLKGTKTKAILTHPMFGPDSSKDGFKGLKIVMDSFTADPKKYNFWKNFFVSQELNVIELPAKEHDRLAARSQGVTHFIGRMLSDFKFSKTEIDTAGAEKLREVVTQTTNDTWELFRGLQNYNPYTKNMRVKLGAAYDHVYNKLLPDQIIKGVMIFGIQGGIGSFNEQMVLKYIADQKIKNYEIRYLYTSERVLKEVHGGNVDIGLFAIHNSIGGIVDESIQAMARYKFTIVKELSIPIQHFLMKRKDIAENSIKIIMAHPQVFKQCTSTLKKSFSRLKQKSGSGDLVDTAKAGKALAEGELPKNTAILGPKRLAELYNLDIIAENLQDDKTNNTAFLLVSR